MNIENTQHNTQQKKFTYKSQTKMQKNLVLFTVFTFAFLWNNISLAICPLCTIAVGAGIGLAEWLGIDDTISGLWIGGLIVSLIGWTIVWLNKRNIKFFGRKIIIALAYYTIMLAPLYWKNIIGHPLNTLWGVDKLLLGIIIGSALFIIASVIYMLLKVHNNNKPYFPMQKVIMPVIALTLASGIFYFLTR